MGDRSNINCCFLVKIYFQDIFQYILNIVSCFFNGYPCLNIVEMVDDKNQDLTRIWVSIPTEYLEKFDSIINGFYPSRSEAIRSGMFSVLKDIRGYKRLANSKNGNSWEDS